MMTRLPVLFVHGYPLDGRMWRHQRELAPEYDVHILDLPGFGTVPIGPEAAPASLALYAGAVLKEFETHRIERAVLVGLSMGGYVLFECWRRFPHRIAALVLADTRAEPDTPEARERRYAGAEQVRRGEQSTYLPALWDALVAPARRGDGALRSEVLAMMADARPDGVVHALLAMAERADARPLLPAIDVPSLIVVGAEDAITPPAVARDLADSIAGASLHQIAGAGHLSPLEQPQEFNEQLRRFLRRLE
jgi:pimeloyl-ACP methyl ester carboxylesterase